jgi:hypothetical protein
MWAVADGVAINTQHRLLQSDGIHFNFDYWRVPVHKVIDN